MSSSSIEESDDTPVYRSSEDLRNENRVAINEAYVRPTMFSGFDEIIHTETPELKMITFKRGDCSVVAQYINEDIYIFSFSCSKSGTGVGKFLLHDVLIHLKDIYPGAAYVTIDPVPQMDPTVWRGLSFEEKAVRKEDAIRKLAGYYEKLGFTEKIYTGDTFPTLLGDITTILRTIETLARGAVKRKTKGRKTRTRKGHKTKRRKGVVKG